MDLGLRWGFRRIKMELIDIEFRKGVVGRWIMLGIVEGIGNV